MKLTFLGGTGTVTGSKYLLEQGGGRLMIDCGLFQGLKDLRTRNWAPLPVLPRSIDAVCLTHAHLDHSGYLPVLVKNGFSGPIYATEATIALCKILLRDSAFLQEKDAEYANRKGYSRHKPAKPLYTIEDAEAALKLFKAVEFEKPFEPVKGLEAEFRCAGHILGAASIVVRSPSASIQFSGDLGRQDDPLMLDPQKAADCDYYVVESTYGNRLHADKDVDAELTRILLQAARQGGHVIVPAFAVGRTQTLLHYLERLRRMSKIPSFPVFLDSPMAINASDIYCDNSRFHRLTDAECARSCGIAEYTREVWQSKELAHLRVPSIIISASGMATGGRVLHHLKHYAGDYRNTILFTGFQAAGTRGRALVEGRQSVKIHGEDVYVRARVYNLDVLSAHADRDELVSWFSDISRPPRAVFVTHGERTASESLVEQIEAAYGWTCSLPEHGQTVELS